LSGHTYPGIFAVKLVEFVEMINKHAVDLGDLRQRQMHAGRQVMVDFAKYPWSSLSSPADHDRVRPGMFEYLPGFFRRGNVAVGDNGNFRRSLYRGDGVIFRMTGVGTGTSTSMNSQGLHAGTLGNSCYGN